LARNQPLVQRAGGGRGGGGGLKLSIGWLEGV
jgi:hypothetical protein